MDDRFTPQQAAQAALDIWDGGACNPRGVARALVKAIDYGREADDMAPAHLILAHLAHLMGASFDGFGDFKPHGDESLGACCNALEHCRALAKREA